MKYFQEPKICPICGKGKKFLFIKNWVDRENKKPNEHSLYQCSECGVQFWLPLGATQSDWYRDNNPYQVRELVKNKINRGYHKKFLEKNRKFPAGTKVLDIGCGAGEFISELKKRGCEAWGVDFDVKAIQIAKQRFGLKNIYALSFKEFFQRKDLPKFDIVTFFEVIEHLADPEGFIESVRELLKPQGKIILSTPCRERMLADLNGWDFPPHHFTRWDRGSIENIFKKNGFYIANINYVERLKILSESFAGRFKTGLVGKSLAVVRKDGHALALARIVYFLGRVKDLVLGRFPAIFLWIFGKFFNWNNGIMLIELERGTPQPIKSKKVIFFIPTLTTGGGERVVSELSLNLSDCIKKTIVLFKNEVSYPYGGKLVCLNIPISNPLILKMYYFFVSFLRFRRVIKNEKPDYVISFGTPANIINVLSNKKAIVRIDNFMSSSAKGIYKVLIKLLFNKASQIICVSKASAEDLVENFRIKKDKIRVIYNPLDINNIQKLSAEPIGAEYRGIFERPVIINIGRMSEQKGQWYLIRAFKEVKKTVKDAQLVILGKGEMQINFERMARDLGIETDVHFLGWQENPFKFLAKSRVFVLSSLWEGLPYVVLEAMACGLPIISVDCKSGPREILAPETNINKEAIGVEYAEYGILVPVFDGKKYEAAPTLSKSENLLGQIIVEVLTNKKNGESLINKSKKRANHFDVKNIIKEWEFLKNENNQTI